MSITLKTLANTSKRLVASGAKFNEQMQEHLVNIVTFINDPQYNGEANATTGNGNVTPATELVALITRKADREAIIAWFTKHGGMKYQNETKASEKKAAQPARFKRDAPATFIFDAKVAAEDKWYADKVAKASSDVRTTKFDAPSKLKAFINSFNKAAHDGVSIKDDNMPEALLADLNALYVKHVGASAIEATVETVKAPAAANDGPRPAPVKTKAS